MIFSNLQSLRYDPQNTYQFSVVTLKLYYNLTCSLTETALNSYIYIFAQIYTLDIHTSRGSHLYMSTHCNVDSLIVSTARFNFKFQSITSWLNVTFLSDVIKLGASSQSRLLLHRNVTPCFWPFSINLQIFNFLDFLVLPPHELGNHYGINKTRN